MTRADSHPIDTALLIIDMISTWDFPDAADLLFHARPIAEPIAALKARCRQAGVPVIYANDNLGRWNVHFQQLVDSACAEGAAGADIARRLAPDAHDYFVLKPKHSAFYATVLEVLLRQLGVRRLILTGVSSDQCVMTTLSEARMRDLAVVVPRDCVATQSGERNRVSLAQYAGVHKVETPGSAEVLLRSE